MSRSFLRNSLLLITYAVLLVLALIKFDLIWDAFYAFLSALSPLFLGFAIAFVLSRPCNAIHRQLMKVFPRRSNQYAKMLAVLLSYVLLVVCVGGLLSFVIPKISDSMSLFLDSFERALPHIQLWLTNFIASLDMDILNSVEVDFSQLSVYFNQILTSMMGSMSSAAGQVVSFTSALFGFAITLVLSVVFSVYILYSGNTLFLQYDKLVRAYLPKNYATRVLQITDISATTFSNFISGQLTEAVILGVLCTAGTLFIYADYAPLVGVIVGVFSLIPIAGAYLGAILAAFMLLMVSPTTAVIFLIFLTILQQIEGNIIYPRVVGTSIGLPGIWVLTAVTVGGTLFGLGGILLSVPVVSILYTLLRDDVNSRLNGEPSSLDSKKN